MGMIVSNQVMDKGLESGIIVKAGIIEELAKKIDVPVDNLKSTVARYQV